MMSSSSSSKKTCSFNGRLRSEELRRAERGWTGCSLYLNQWQIGLNNSFVFIFKCGENSHFILSLLSAMFISFIVVNKLLFIMFP